MKKWICAALSALMVMSLSACVMFPDPYGKAKAPAAAHGEEAAAGHGSEAAAEHGEEAAAEHGEEAAAEHGAEAAAH